MTYERRMLLIRLAFLPVVTIQAIGIFASPGSIWDDLDGLALAFSAILLALSLPPTDTRDDPNRIAEDDAIALLRVWDNTPFCHSMLEHFVENHGEQAPYLTASVHARLGRADDAFRWLGKARSNDDPRLSELHDDPLFVAIHHDLSWRTIANSST